MTALSGGDARRSGGSAASLFQGPQDGVWPHGGFWRLWTGVWQAPVAAAVIVLFAALPGLASLPVLDRDEARFSQSTAQMLESGDFVDIRFQDQPRDKKPVGINWLQALSVQWLSSAEARDIWAYRLPSLIGAMAAAAACAWGAASLLGRRAGLAAGAVLGASFILSSEAFIAKTDAVLCASVTLSMVALARIYAAERSRDPPARGMAALFWCGQAAAILVKGPVGPMIAGLTMATLWGADRQAPWLRKLRWDYGLLFLAAVLGPWAVAITISTDGDFWSRAVDGDLAPKLAGGREGHGMPPGYHLLWSPLLFFPAAFLLPAALAHGWRRRYELGPRFALAWLIPSWLVCEAAPTKLVHYTLPLFGALAWLAAGALDAPVGRWSRGLGAALSGLAGIMIATSALVLSSRFGGPGAGPWAVIAAVLSLSAGAVGAVAIAWRPTTALLLACLGLGAACHAVLAAGLAPRLDALWLSARAAALVAQAHLDPRDGLTLGPVTVAGYAEPSLVFALGTETVLGDAADAADAVADGQPALVEARQSAAFTAALRRDNIAAHAVGGVQGFDYSDRKPIALTLWCATPPAKTTNR